MMKYTCGMNERYTYSTRGATPGYRRCAALRRIFHPKALPRAICDAPRCGALFPCRIAAHDSRAHCTKCAATRRGAVSPGWHPGLGNAARRQSSSNSRRTDSASLAPQRDTYRNPGCHPGLSAMRRVAAHFPSQGVAPGHLRWAALRRFVPVPHRGA
jgi:ribosomal protein S27AE